MLKHWTQIWGTIASNTTKRNLKVDLGKCVQMYKAQFLFLPGVTNSLNPPPRPLLSISKYFLS